MLFIRVLVLLVCLAFWFNARSIHMNLKFFGTKTASNSIPIYFTRCELHFSDNRNLKSQYFIAVFSMLGGTMLCCVALLLCIRSNTYEYRNQNMKTIKSPITFVIRDLEHVFSWKTVVYRNQTSFDATF